MITQCYDCKYADEYLCWWWRINNDPTCLKGLPMYTEDECKQFMRIGRLSR